MNLARLISIPGLAALRSTDGEQLFPVTTVRGWIHADYERFRTECVVRLGQRVMVDLDALEAWLEGRRGTKTAKPNSGPQSPAREARRVSPLKSFDQVLEEAGLA